MRIAAEFDVNLNAPEPPIAMPPSKAAGGTDTPSDSPKVSDWLLSKVQEYVQKKRSGEGSVDLEMLQREIISHISCSRDVTTCPPNFTISRPLGNHFGSSGPDSPPIVRSMSITGPPGSVLRHLIILPDDTEFSVCVEGEQDTSQSNSWTIQKELRLMVTSKASNILGVHVAWLLLLVDTGFDTTIKPDKSSFVIFQPLVKIITDMSITTFKFDVYSKPFVPHPFPGPDFGLFVGSWIPQILGMSSLDLPNSRAIPPIFENKDITVPNLNLKTYCERLRLLLQIEYGARLSLLARGNLYAINILGDTSMRRVVVPGIVDDNPRIRIGDILYIRRVPFDGYEYKVYVHATIRRTCSVFFKLNIMIHPSDNFNVRFEMNDDLVRASGRAIGLLKEWMACPDPYARKVLFPDVEDGTFSQRTDSLTSNRLEYRDTTLNMSQKWGPPGTGKTKTCIEAMYQIIKSNKEFRVLACAPSSSAADTLTRRLKVFLRPKQLVRLIAANRPFAEVPEELLPYTMSRDGHFDLPPMPDILQTRVLVCTCEEADMLFSAGLTNRFSTEAFLRYQEKQEAMNPFFHRQKIELKYPLWTHLLIDEAGQAAETETAIPLAVIANGFSKCESPANKYFVPAILSGDHMQLGPLVESTFGRQNGLQISLFERIIGRQLYKDHPESRDAPSRRVCGESAEPTSFLLDDVRAPFVNLIRNYRSHPSMVIIPSRLSYNNTLVPFADPFITHSLLRLPILPNPDVPILFSGINGIDDRAGEEGASWWNAIEAAKIIQIIKKVIEHSGVTMADFGVISPFREQVKRLRELMRVRGLGSIDVGTVEDYQGMERRIIVLSCVRSRPRFLAEDLKANVGVVNFPQRLNVALTRAKSLLIIVGNPALLVTDPHWLAYLTFYVQNGCYEGCPLPPQLIFKREDSKASSSPSRHSTEQPQTKDPNLTSSIMPLASVAAEPLKTHLSPPIRGLRDASTPSPRQPSLDSVPTTSSPSAPPTLAAAKPFKTPLSSPTRIASSSSPRRPSFELLSETSSADRPSLKDFTASLPAFFQTDVTVRSVGISEEIALGRDEDEDLESMMTFGGGWVDGVMDGSEAL
ncbi:hypothetical protein HDU67_007455 [Dinochytrium kinnereticum]|nr:hypothetical protein HDU67_007455 [Dinochytrium kinnereticum]